MLRMLDVSNAFRPFLIRIQNKKVVFSYAPSFVSSLAPLPCPLATILAVVVCPQNSLPPSHHTWSIGLLSFPDLFVQYHGPYFGFSAFTYPYTLIFIFLTFGNFNPRIGLLGNNNQSQTLELLTAKYEGMRHRWWKHGHYNFQDTYNFYCKASISLELHHFVPLPGEVLDLTLRINLSPTNEALQKKERSPRPVMSLVLSGLW